MYVQTEAAWEVGEKTPCWGYEKGCTEEKRLFVPHCDEPAKPWTQTLEEKHEMFWRQGDFGYIKQEMESMMQLCYPLQQKGKSFKEQIESVGQDCTSGHTHTAALPFFALAGGITFEMLITVEVLSGSQSLHGLSAVSRDDQKTRTV